MSTMNRPPIASLALFAQILTTTSALAGESVFEPPTRLKADDQIIDTGKAWGHSSPAVFDVNGDALPDLVVGDFGGKFHTYLNTGTAEAPVYSKAGTIQAGG